MEIPVQERIPQARFFLFLLTHTLMGYIIQIPYRGMKERKENAMTDKVPDKEICGCCEKTTARTEEERKKLIHRLNRIEGQIRGIRGMIEKDAYCADILMQSAAVNAAVNAFNKELLAHHIKGCVARDIREGKDEVIDELVATLQKLMK